MFRLSTLGGLHLLGPDGPVTGAPAQRKALAVLALLASGRTSRDRLVGYLWPEASAEKARHGLAQIVYAIRKDLGAELVFGTTELWLDPGVIEVDGWEFEQALAAHTDARALDLYRGPFLHGFFLTDADEFERWAEGERERLRRLAIAAARRLMDGAERDGAPALAAQWAHRYLDLAPDDEKMLGRLVGLLDRAGDRTGAIRAYDHFARKLLEDYELEPSAETRGLVAAIRMRSPAIPVAGPIAVAGVAPSGSPAMEPAAPPGVVAPGRRVARRPSLLIGLAAAAAAVLGLGLWSVLRHPEPPLDPNRIVVAPFVNETGDSTLDRVGRFAADWITQGLAETGFAAVVDARTVRQLAPPSGTPVGRPALGTSDWIARATGSGMLVEGAYYREGPSAVRLQVRVVDARTDHLLRAIAPVHAETAALLPALNELRQRTMAALATLRDPREAGLAAHSSQPPTFAAYQEYATGEELFIRRDWRGAIEHFLRASALDSAYVLPLLWVSVAAIQIDQPAKADSIVRRLEAVRARLAPTDLAMLDWLSAYLRGDRIGAYQSSLRLRELAPGSEAEYQLGVEALRVGRPRETIAASANLDPTLGAMKGRYDYWTTLTAAEHLLGQHDRELRDARRGVAQYRENLATLLGLVRALAALGREHDVTAALDASESLASNRRATPGLVMRTAALELRAHGHPEAARAAATRAIRWYRTQPAAIRDNAANQEGLARALYLAGQWDEAQRIFARLVAPDTASVDDLGYLGVLAARRDDRAAAARISDQLAHLDRPYLWGQATCWRARIAALLGERVRAVELLRAAAAEGYRYAWDHHADPDLETLRDFPPFVTLIQPKE